MGRHEGQPPPAAQQRFIHLIEGIGAKWLSCILADLKLLSSQAYLVDIGLAQNPLKEDACIANASVLIENTR